MRSSIHLTKMTLRTVVLTACIAATAAVALGQDIPVSPPQPAYLAVVEGHATLDRDGEIVPAVVNMPFVQGDRLRTTDGRVQVAFPDGTAIELAENSEVECISPTRVRLLAGVMDHVQLAVTPSKSAQYLPRELNTYGPMLDQGGSWAYDANYGNVWYPTVAADWRPYYYGYWSPIGSYGWTWIGVDVWAWPTHHYGRWGYSRNRWFWIPGRTWGPAWVSWGSAPGYVSWCPLGFDGRPVFALSVGFGSPWLGWTVIPRGGFGSYGYYAHRNNVDPRRLPSNATFVARNAPPATPPTRVGRRNVDNAPTTGTAVRRNGAQPPATTRQATPPAQGASVPSRQTPVGQPAGAATQSSSGAQAETVTPGQSPVGVRRVTPADSQVPVHYGTTAPRSTTTPPPAGSTRATSPTPPPSAAPHSTPPSPSGAQPRTASPPAERSAPAAAPRTPPSGAPNNPPAQAPAGAPAQARPAPSGSAPQGGTSQGEGRARSSGRGRSS